MILRTKTTKSNLNSIKQGDELELVVSNVNNNNELVEVIVKVIIFKAKKEKCAGCETINAIKG